MFKIKFHAAIFVLGMKKKKEKKIRLRRCKACGRTGVFEDHYAPCNFNHKPCSICDSTGRVSGDEDAAFDPANFTEEHKEAIRDARKMI